MSWTTFIEREEGVKYKCEVCLDYGGLINTDVISYDGLPEMMACNDCPDLDHKKDEVSQ
jgi:hypothetical protein